jgi:isoleucyl-tRNA synthetase
VEIVYLPQKEIEDRLLAAQIIDTEKGGVGLASQFESQLANKDEALLDISEVEAVIASGTKCNRCWRYTEDTSGYGIWKKVCARCQSALKEMGIDPPLEAAS